MATMRKCLQNATRVLVAAAVGSVPWASEESQCSGFDVGPVNGTNLLSLENCLSTWGVEDARSRELLGQALRHTREEAVLVLLRRGVEPLDTSTFLNLAASADLPKVVSFMLDRDTASTAETAPLIQPLLDLAAKAGAYRVTRLLLDRGAKPTTPDGLLQAVAQPNLHIFQLLVERGARLDQLPADGAARVFSSAARSRDWVFLKQILEEHRLDPNMVVSEDTEGIHILAMTGVHEDERMGRSNWGVLIQYGADPVQMACDLSERQLG